MNMGFNEFKIKLNSLPEDEPLFKIIKSRSIDLMDIKDKEERRYWRCLKRINAIPPLYLSSSELDSNLKSELGKGINL